MVKKRNHYFKKAQCSGSSIDYSKFQQFRNKVVSKLQLAKRKFFSNLYPQNPKEFWKIIRSLRESSFPPLKNKNIITSPSPTVQLQNCPSLIFLKLSLLTIQMTYVLFEVLLIPPCKSSSDDDISAGMLKDTALRITPVVTQHFNISLKLGGIPDEWNIARVSPILKSHNN